MDLFSIASGSSGNCICVGNMDHHVLIDCGISGKKVEEGMNDKGFTTSDMEGILITHEHMDHVAGLGVLARRYGLPMYATRGTIAAIQENHFLGKIDETLFHPIEAGKSFTVGGLSIDPVHISHDAIDPVAYVISDGKKKVGILTDLGTYDRETVSHFKGCNGVLIEANHDVNMLECGPYPYDLKMRILSDRGHLSNEASGRLLSEILNDDMEQVILGHLSKENNFPDLASRTVSIEVTLSETEYKGSDFPIRVAGRTEATDLIEL